MSGEYAIEFRIKVAILSYPGLYQDTGRMGVLNQFFCVCGNGMEWHEGYIREKPPLRSDSIAKAEAILKAGFEIPFRFWDSKKKRILGPLMYPLSRHAKICNCSLR